MSENETVTLDFPNRSASIAKLVGALAKVQGEMVGAAKDSTNPHFKSKYADLASVWDACRKPLAKNGLAILQPVTAEGPNVTVTTILAHDSGEWISESLTMTAQQNTPQGVGSTITYGRRYGLSAMVGIAPEDDDGEAASSRGLGAASSNGRTSDFGSEHAGSTPAAAAKPASSGEDIGPVVLASVGPGRAGAVAELVLPNGDRFLAFKQPIKVKAEHSIKSGEAVMLSIKRSTSGNRYVDALTPTGMTAEDIMATKFKHDDAIPLTDSEIPF